MGIFRPGVMKPFGLDYNAFKGVNPPMIMYVFYFGLGAGWALFGADGADITTQAYSGKLDPVLLWHLQR
jgi:crotonobetainyl-CoA:carnitine CoA-transferase CaiB-like acyl-CoA transferase